MKNARLKKIFMEFNIEKILRHTIIIIKYQYLHLKKLSSYIFIWLYIAGKKREHLLSQANINYDYFKIIISGILFYFGSLTAQTSENPLFPSSGNFYGSLVRTKWKREKMTGQPWINLRIRNRFRFGVHFFLVHLILYAM